MTIKEWAFLYTLWSKLHSFQNNNQIKEKNLIYYFFIIYMVWFPLKAINEDITLRYLNFLSTNVRPLQKSIKWMTETFIDQATYSVSLLFSKYCFKLDKHVNKIISDSVSLYLVRDWHAATQIKKFMSAEIFGVERVMMNR